MKITTAKMMLSAAALAIVTFTAAPARATTVDFYTEASIDGGTLSANPLQNFVTFGSGADSFTLSFTGVVSSVTAPSFTNFGTINTIGTADGNTFPSNTSFVLDIFQTQPGVGSGTLDAVLNGSISFSQSSATITFSQLSTVINGVTYTIPNNPLALVPPSGGGHTTIQGEVNASTTPEPMTTALVGAGLLGLGMVRRRKA